MKLPHSLLHLVKRRKRHCSRSISHLQFEVCHVDRLQTKSNVSNQHTYRSAHVVSNQIISQAVSTKQISTITVVLAELFDLAFQILARFLLSCTAKPDHTLSVSDHNTCQAVRQSITYGDIARREFVDVNDFLDIHLTHLTPHPPHNPAHLTGCWRLTFFSADSFSTTGDSSSTAGCGPRETPSRTEM